MKYKVTLRFIEPLLGTAPLNRELYADFIATRAPEPANGDAEIETIEELTEKGTTGFHRQDGQPILYDYVLKGFCKDACGMLRRVPGMGSAKLTNFKKVIDGLLFVKPRQIPIQIVGEIGILERPLRAQTAQGERIALSRSESISAGSTLSFEVVVLGQITEALLREWLDYGALRGLGAWRNASWGRFLYELTNLP